MIGSDFLKDYYETLFPNNYILEYPCQYCIDEFMDFPFCSCEHCIRNFEGQNDLIFEE